MSKRKDPPLPVPETEPEEEEILTPPYPTRLSDDSVPVLVLSLTELLNAAPADDLWLMGRPHVYLDGKLFHQVGELNGRRLYRHDP